MKLLGLEAGRFNRSTFILTSLVSMFVFVIVAMIIGGILFPSFELVDSYGRYSGGSPVLLPVAVLWWVYHSLCVVRRLHDLGMSGWWLVGYFVPFVNFIISLKLLFERGEKEKNRFGEPLLDTYIMGLKIIRHQRDGNTKHENSVE